MKVHINPYPSMKDSGVPWVGAVPSHWTRSKLRSLLERVAERNRPDLPLLSVVREKGVILRDLSNSDENHNFIPDDLTNYKRVRRGQFAMNKMKAWQGSYGVSDHEGIVSPAYFVFDLQGVEGRFFHLAIRSRAYVSFFTQASDGVRIGQWDLSDSRMREIPFFVPPPAEQGAIVRFIDHADRRIRRYIRAKQTLIKLLEEQKQAIIHRAVTHGASAAVGYKSSGVPGWPSIPLSYERVRLGRVCLSIRDGTHNPPPAVPGVHRLLSVRNIIGGRFVTREDDRTMTPAAFDDLQRSYHVRRGDVVIALVGATTGKSAVVGDMENVTVQRSVGILRPDSRLLTAEFLNLVIRSELIQGQIRQVMNKYAAQPGIYLEEVGRLQVCFPEVQEQRAILMRVAEDSAPLDTALKQAASEIDLLKEFRTRLIADIVTGKLDVKEAAARLPQDLDEREPLEESEPDSDEADEGIEAVADEAGA
jgi:type I restriction enzyme S subunit